MQDLKRCGENLKLILCETGSQCRFFNRGVAWSERLDPMTRRVSVFSRFASESASLQTPLTEA